MIAAQPPPRTRPQPHPHFVFPIVLIAIGALALLAQTGRLPEGTIQRLIDLWPMLLVLLGVQILVTRLMPTRAGSLLALAIMLVLVVVGFAYALGGPTVGASRSYQATGPVAGISTATLRLDTAGATVHLQSGDLGSDLYRADVGYAPGHEPSVRFADNELRVTTSAAPSFGWLQTPARDRVDLAVSDGVGWAVVINGAGVDGDLDLSRVQVSGVRLNGAGARLDMRLPADPGREVPVTVAGAGLNLSVRVPRDMPVRVSSEGLGTLVEVDGVSKGGTWTSPGWDGAQARYDIHVSGVGSHVRLITG